MRICYVRNKQAYDDITNMLPMSLRAPLMGDKSNPSLVDAAVQVLQEAGNIAAASFECYQQTKSCAVTYIW